jgi:hypothetical protein
VADGTFRFDFNFDQPPGSHLVHVRIRDDDGGATTIARQVTVVAAGQSVENVQLFYNNSAYDGNGPAVTAADFAAIALDKAPLAVGASATFANVSGYLRGINGIFIDIPNLPNDGAGIDATDFQFTIGNSNFSDTWALAPSPTKVGVLPGAGPGGSDRLYVTFADGAIKDTWLRITVRANADTNLSASEHFFFGSVPGDTGAAFAGQGLFFGREAADMLSIASGLFKPANVTSPNDVNRDRVVNAFDLHVIPIASGGGVDPNVISAIVPQVASPGIASAWIASLAIDEAIGSWNSNMKRQRLDDFWIM